MRSGICAAAWALLGLPSLLAQEEAPPLAELIGQLQSPTTQVRRDAARELERLGSGAAPAAEALAGSLGDDDTQVWFHSVSALARIGPAALPALPALLEDLESYRPGRASPRWYRSAHALSRMGEAALEPLRQALAHENPGVRAGAAQALGWMEETALTALPGLLRLMEDSEEFVARQAALAVGGLGEAALPALEAGLEEPRPPAPVLIAIEAMGEAAAPLAPRLARLAAAAGMAGLADREASGEDAALALRALDATGSEAIGPLIWPLMRHPSEAVRRALIDAALELPPERTVPKLSELLGNPDHVLRRRAADLLGRIGPPAASAVPLLVRMIEEDEASSAPLLDALVAMGPAAMDPILEHAAGDPRALQSGHWTASALGRFGIPGLERLRRALLEGGPELRMAALHAVGTMGRDGRPALKAIEAGLESEEPGIRAAALSTAVALSTDPDGYRTAVARLLEDESAEVRAAAARASALLSSVDQAILDRLEPLLAPPGTRLAALEALGRIGSPARGLAGPVSAHLDSEEDALLVAALDCLGALGEAPGESIGRIYQLCREAAQPVRHAALKCLERLGEEGEEIRDLFRLALGSGHEGLRQAGIAGLGRSGADPAEILEASLAGLSDPSAPVRLAAADNLGRLEELAVEATGPLLRQLSTGIDASRYMTALRSIPPHSSQLAVYREGLEDSSPAVRAFSCRRLGDLGDEAAPARQRLEELSRRDRYSSVRREAREALEQIAP